MYGRNALSTGGMNPPPTHMANEHSLKPLWVGIACMAAGVALIYWVFHSGDSTTDEQSETDGGVVCAQVITPAKDPDTGEIVEYQTPCDVPDEWEVVQPDIVQSEKAE